MTPLLLALLLAAPPAGDDSADVPEAITRSMAAWMDCLKPHVLADLPADSSVSGRAAAEKAFPACRAVEIPMVEAMAREGVGSGDVKELRSWMREQFIATLDARRKEKRP